MVAREQLDVKVLAEDEEETFEWMGRLCFDSPLSELATSWATQHKLEVNGVGFETAQGVSLDLSKSPHDLGWSVTDAPIVIYSIPLIDDYVCDKDMQTERTTQSAASPPKRPSKSDVAKQASPAKKSRTGPPAGGASVSPPDAASATSAAASSHAGPLQEAIKAPVVAAAAPKASKDTSKVPVVAAKAPKVAVAKSRPDDGEVKTMKAFVDKLITTDAPMVIQQNNPKSSGSKSAQRYDEYKTAKTAKEVLAKGAAKPDLTNDIVKGFMHPANQALHSELQRLLRAVE